MNGDEFKEYLNLWSMRIDMASKNSGIERVRELLLECLITYGGSSISNKKLKTEDTEKVKVKLRMPNESYFDEVLIHPSEFSATNFFQDEVFGWYLDTFVSMDIESYNKIK